jgi:DNA-directed RNA polymerase subunit omega
MKTEFLTAALTEVKSPQILVNMVSRRVRQLGMGYRPLVAVNPTWSFMDVALKEIADKKLTYETVAVDDAETVRKKAPKPRKRKLSL